MKTEAVMTVHAKNAFPQCGMAYRFLDNFIFIFAALSVLTRQTWRWMDLNFAGQATATVLPIIWLISLACLAMSRRMGASGAAGGIDEEQLQRRLRINRLLLIPSWLVLLTLLLNTVDYYQLWKKVNGDLPFCMPMCLPILVILGAWLWGRPDRVIVGRPAEQQPLPARYRMRRSHPADLAIIAPAALLVIWVFFFEFRADPPPDNTPVDLAVVFGNAVLPDGSCGFIMRNRVMAAIELYDQKRVKYIMVSGNAPLGRMNPVENSTLAMWKMCITAGIPTDRIFIDFSGDNTRYSAENAVKLMHENGFTSVVGVSSDYHLPRISVAFAQLGVHAWTVPAVNGYWSQIDPHSMVREWFAMPVYWLNHAYHREELSQ
jgi:vancomycin permeability regulator SanA